jgi:hypothetical protein
MKLTPPTPEEFSPYYTDYIQRARDQVDVLGVLPMQIDALNSMLGRLTEEQTRFRFGPAEWSIKELVGHLNDVERVFSYRLLRVSRNDKTPIPGFEQDDYVREAGFDEHPLKDLLQEFELLRRANILMINNMSEEAIQRIGTASNNPVSARALIYMLVGHVDHHVASLQENYLSARK